MEEKSELQKLWERVKQEIMAGLPLAQEVIIAGDNDPAGRKAAIQAAENWTREGRDVRLVFPPVDQDFNDLVMEKFQ